MAVAENRPSDPNDVYHDALGNIGYTKTQAEKRVKIYNTVAENCTLFCRRYTGENIDVIIPGSRGEGTGIYSESDVDMLFVQRTVQCMDIYQNSDTGAPVLFLLEFENDESGYTMLRLISIGYTRTDKQFIRKVKDGLVQRNRRHYLRNDQIFTAASGHHRQGFARQQFVFDDTTGPARKVVCELSYLGTLSVDRVLAFPCSCPSILNTWCKRERKHDDGWPNNDLVEKVKHLEVFVVPVGEKGSADEVLQWRISVTLAERALVQSFNDTQIKLYAAMKMLAKQELNPVCGNISSYVVKHLVFWMFEEECIEKFTRRNFGECLMQLLHRFKRCVTWRYVPNYMFPSRNILKNKILEKERVELINRLDKMMGEGIFVLRRSPLIKEEIDLPKEYFQNRVMFEELAEQVALSMFCIPSPYFKIFMRLKIIPKSLFRLTEKQIFKVVFNYAIPLIRVLNPYGYFNHVRAMPNEEILIRLLEGVSLYLNK